MKNLKDIITEKLKVSSNSNVDNSSQELDDIVYHFMIDSFVDGTNGYEEKFITQEEENKIKERLEDFIKANNVKYDNLKYFANRGYKSGNKKIDKDFKTNTNDWESLNWKLNFAKDKKRLFKKGGLCFEVSPDKKIIGMGGPYGGMKFCTY